MAATSDFIDYWGHAMKINPLLLPVCCPRFLQKAGLLRRTTCPGASRSAVARSFPETIPFARRQPFLGTIVVSALGISGDHQWARNGDLDSVGFGRIVGYSEVGLQNSGRKGTLSPTSQMRLEMFWRPYIDPH